MKYKTSELMASRDQLLQQMPDPSPFCRGRYCAEWCAATKQVAPVVRTVRGKVTGRFGYSQSGSEVGACAR